MNEEQEKQLRQLKERLQEKVDPIINQENLAPEQRFQILMAAGTYKEDYAKFDEAYAVAEQIEDTQLRDAAFLDLLDEVDKALGDVVVSDEAKEVEQKLAQEDVSEGDSSGSQEHLVASPHVDGGDEHPNPSKEHNQDNHDNGNEHHEEHQG